MKIGPISDCKMNQSALLDLLAPTNERVMLAGFENLAFTSDECDDYGFFFCLISFNQSNSK